MHTHRSGHDGEMMMRWGQGTVAKRWDYAAPIRLVPSVHGDRRLLDRQLVRVSGSGSAPCVDKIKIEDGKPGGWRGGTHEAHQGRVGFYQIVCVQGWASMREP